MNGQGPPYGQIDGRVRSTLPVPVRAGARWPAPLNTAFDYTRAEYAAPTSAYSDHAPDSALTAASSAHARGSSPASSQSSEHDHTHSPDDGSGAKKKKKTRDRVPLAADQPLTSQGKERQRVYLACAQCRQRKIRCDGAKPTCEVCIKRGVAGCTYDSAPKRRGPDRLPGARQRLRVDEPDDSGVIRRRRRRRSNDEREREREDAPQASPYDSLPSFPTYVLQEPPRSATVTTASFQTSPTADLSPLSDRGGGTLATADTYPYSSHSGYGQVTAVGYPTAVAVPASSVPAAYILDEEDSPPHEPAVPGYGFASEPTVHFIRETWWDNLLALYCGPGGGAFEQVAPGALATRDLAAHAITTDLRFLFRHSNHWLAFFHVRSFLDTLFVPDRRARMQPALVLAALALSTLLQSSELGRAAAGRDVAFRIRDAAQGALDASVAARWVDDHLAQAAFLLAIFEVCGHPRHNAQRARDAMVLLDGIIRTLQLTMLDREDPYVTTYQPPAALPGARRHGQAELRKECYGAPRTPPSTLAGPDAGMPPDPHLLNYRLYAQQQQQPGLPDTANGSPCSCQALSLGARSHVAREQTPMWLATAGWSNDWDEGQVRKEACRRLCWSALGLAAGHTSYASAVTGAGQDLAITNPANFALLFNGEAMHRADANYGARVAKDTVWALYNRVMLLWHGCLRLRMDGALPHADKAQFAMAAWLELDAIEAALDGHTCGVERAYLFQGREVVFNTRMAISYEYQKFIPDVMSNFNGFFHRAKAEAWLTRQRALAAGMVRNFGDLTGLRSNMLTYRPFFSLWLMAQVSRCLMLWSVDSSLMLALEVAEAWLPPLEYLLAVWPSAAMRDKYDTLRERLISACVVAGYRLPPPSTLALATPVHAL